MSNTYTIISKTTLTGSQSNITLSSIPSTYTDLELHISSRFNNSADFDIVNLQFNSDSGSNYSSNLTIQGYNGSASTNAPSAKTVINLGYAPAANATSSTFGSMKIYIPGYAQTTTKKSISADSVMENNSSSAYVLWLTGSIWQTSSSAIDTITLTCNSGASFVSGTSVYLYGIKNS
jgi:hypothetical protein